MTTGSPSSSCEEALEVLAGRVDAAHAARAYGAVGREREHGDRAGRDLGEAGVLDLGDEPVARAQLLGTPSAWSVTARAGQPAVDPRLDPARVGRHRRRVGDLGHRLAGRHRDARVDDVGHQLAGDRARRPFDRRRAAPAPTRTPAASWPAARCARDRRIGGSASTAAPSRSPGVGEVLGPAGPHPTAHRERAASTLPGRSPPRRDRLAPALVRPEPPHGRNRRRSREHTPSLQLLERTPPRDEVHPIRILHHLATVPATIPRHELPGRHDLSMLAPVAQLDQSRRFLPFRSQVRVLPGVLPTAATA